MVEIRGLLGSKLRISEHFGYVYVYVCDALLVNTISPDCLVRSSSNSVCVFPTMSTGSLLFLVQIQGLFGSKLRKSVIYV